PGNVIIPNDGGVKLLDFGLAKFVEGGSPLELDAEEAPPPSSADSTAATIDIGGANVPPGGTNPLYTAETPKPMEPAGADSAGQPASRGSQVRVSYRQLLASEPSSQQLAALRKSIPPVLAPSATAVSASPASAELPPEVSAHSSQGDGESLPEYTSTIKGTPVYMAPEVLSGEPATRRSDIYSMGALLYELCTGAPPHVNTSLVDLQRIVSTQNAPPLASVTPMIDPRFAAIVDRCLGREPAQRYSSAEELRDALEQLVPGAHRDEIPEGNPYRGLLAFEAQHRALFFGRKSEIGTLIDRLRTESFLLVAADSGVGKSSLCRAGVLPLVTDGALGGSCSYTTAVLVPGRKPLVSLCSAVAAALSCEESVLQTAIEKSPMSFARTLRKQLGAGRGIMLFLDQMEELVTIGDPTQSAQVSEALSSIALHGGEVRLLCTARSDFLSRLATLPGLGDEVTRALYLLRPMGPDKLREAVVGPALIKGVSFESDALVDSLVQSTARTDGGLPLLQFALAELWEVRGGGVITTAALDSIGGVAGALARHGDHVVGALPPEQRLSARRILMSLVTLERTRARRTDEELTRSDPSARPALDALVRGRLLVARDTAEGAAYEVAHEAPIRGWDTLGRWLDEHAESRAVKQRLETAAYEWNRLGRARDALWGSRQLAETVILNQHDIGPREADFLSAARAAVRRSRQVRRAALVAIPLLLGVLYGGVRIAAHRDVGRRVAALMGRARTAISEAQGKNAHVEQLRQQAFALFDAKERDKGEDVWKQALTLAADADRVYARAGRTLEAALILDSSRADVRSLLTDGLYERAVVAQRDDQVRQLDDLLQRMALYDTDGTRQKKWSAPGHLEIQTSPPGAQVRLEQYVDTDDKRRSLASPRELGVTPLSRVPVAPGSYLLTFTAPGRTVVRYPFVISREESLKISTPLPAEAELPKGFVYIPAGRFLFGNNSEESVRQLFLQTVPLHQVETPAYLVARTETTFGEWIEYLQSLPAEERQKRTPKAGSTGLSGVLELTELGPQRWQLLIQPKTDKFSATTGEPLRYPARKSRAVQDWYRFPVGGISLEDARAYVDWLDRSGRVRGAHICSEHEWERAAKGADDRNLPSGLKLAPDDANFDQTYQKNAACYGPDEVGAHPGGRSPFGIDDMAGNNFEWTVSSVSPDEYVVRGASFAFDELSVYSNNRNPQDPSVRLDYYGLRVCAAPPASL
ncbi:MAG TPA: SUMF1/EgtB/PvdO family nonheme iron enzyme, partial [Pseudomonadota bacterium]|nr:SUMF1/EgtB/PvdO family nonheme iron enzyme [Pseudomonadota bacterium]